jgi:hypothetical protein
LRTFSNQVANPFVIGSRDTLTGANFGSFDGFFKDVYEQMFVQYTDICFRENPVSCDDR